MDEEKTIDEEKTVDEAVEEMIGEMKEFEPVAFDEAVKETEPERKDAPILRDAPDPADMNMIHKHVDNFLAKIAGETPIDENVRDSTEYWLNRIAEAGGGGTEVVANPTLAGTEDPLTGLQVGDIKYNTKKYCHIIFSQGQQTCAIVLNNNPTQFTETSLAQYLIDNGFIGSTHPYPLIPVKILIPYGNYKCSVVTYVYSRSSSPSDGIWAGGYYIDENNDVQSTTSLLGGMIISADIVIPF